MSFIVPMEKPKRCGLCPCFHAEHPMHCQAVKAHKDKRIIAPYGAPIPDWCPLIELPPHGRLGDLDVLAEDLAIFKDGHDEGWGYDGGMYEAYNNSLMLVEDAPTIIEAEKGETDA